MVRIPTSSHEPFRRLRGIPPGVFQIRGERPPTVRPFLTLSRQAGTLSPGFAERLCQRLSDEDEAPWTLADRAVTEQVARQMDLLPAHVDRPISWLREVLDGLRVQPHVPVSEAAVYHHVAATIRALAEEGRALIVGRGGAFITRDLPGGVHLRVIGPDGWRIARLADQQRLSRDAAAKEMHRLDAEQARFYHHWWTQRPDAPEAFTAVLNAARMDESEILDFALAEVRARRAAPTPASQPAV